MGMSNFFEMDTKFETTAPKKPLSGLLKNKNSLKPELKKKKKKKKKKRKRRRKASDDDEDDEEASSATTDLIKQVFSMASALGLALVALIAKHSSCIKKIPCCAKLVSKAEKSGDDSNEGKEHDKKKEEGGALAKLKRKSKYKSKYSE